MVQLKNLSFSYKGKEPLFSKLQLTLNGGNIYGLLGKNGAGKTTLLKIICGLLFARTGESMVMGSSSRQRSPAFLQELFFIPEEFHVPSISVEAFRKYHGPLYPRFSNSDFESYLREFGVKQSEGLSSLSYGNKKKFLIAFGLATQCSLLLLDEPTNGLDIPTKSQFRKLLAGALTDERIFIISTHPVIFFGSIYFRRFALLKTVLSVFTFIIALGFVMFFVGWKLFTGVNGVIALHNFTSNVDAFFKVHGTTLLTGAKIITRFVIPVFFIGLGFLRLTEYEVNNGV